MLRRFGHNLGSATPRNMLRFAWMCFVGVHSFLSTATTTEAWLASNHGLTYRTHVSASSYHSGKDTARSAILSSTIDEYALHWDHLLMEEYKETIQELKERRSKWSPQRLEDYGLAILDAFAEPESEVLGEKTVRIVAAVSSLRNRQRPWSDKFNKGDILEMTALAQEGSSFSVRRRQKSLALMFPPRDCLVMEVGDDWMVVGVGPTWPRGLWETRKHPRGYRVRLDRQTGPTAPLQAQREALQRLRTSSFPVGSAVRLFASLWTPSANGSSLNSTSLVSETKASRIPAYLRSMYPELEQDATSSISTPALQQHLRQGLDRAMQNHVTFAANQQKYNSTDVWKANESQQDAILWALSRKLSLIRGPPGTGKTRTAALLIAAALELQKQQRKQQKKKHASYCSIKPKQAIRVLAVTHSNGAADVLLEALLELGVPAVRAGRPASVSPQVQHRSVIALAEKLPHIKEMRQELLRQSARASFFSSRNNSGDFGAGLQWQLKKSLEDAQSMLLQSAPVVVTSCIGAHQLVELQASNIDCSLFPLVVLDEAAQCTEPALLTALLAAQAQQVVLVGDTQQLPPTVTSSSKTLRESLGVSPMARMEAAGVHQKTLQVQYRMPQALLEHPSRYFYDGMVQSADNIQTDANSPVSLPAGFPWPNASLPLAFVQSGTGDMEMVHTFGGRSNPCEAKQIAVIVSRLLHEGDVFAKDIAILTPYARQVQAIRSALEEQALRLRQGNVTLEAASFPTQQRLRGNSVRDVKVGTIDSFQGQETDIVIFSAVRSNSLSELGFLRDPRRLNVAITRARRGLILLGDSTTLSSCRHWQALIQSCHDRGCFVVEYRMDTVKEASAVFPTGNGTVANATDVLEEIGVLDSTLDFSNTSDSFYGLFSVRDSCDISSLL